MKHGSLFSGGGGFDLAAEFVGWENVFYCERDPFCQTILKHYWPETALHPNIKEFNAEIYQGKVDIITGGFPCQPFSVAGKRRGTGDERYLWPDMLRIIRAVKPRWVVAENVYGLVNWNEGLVFDTVQTDLEAQGFEVWPFVLPAAGLGAPHQRYRVFIVAFNSERPLIKEKVDHNVRTDIYPVKLETAHPDTYSNGCNRRDRKDEKQRDQTRQHAQHDAYPLDPAAADTDSKGLEGWLASGKSDKGRKKALKQFARFCERQRWKDWPTRSPLCSGDDGLPATLDGITFSKWRQNSVKMYGNAVVPQIAARVFKAIIEFERLQKTSTQDGTL